MPGGGYLDADRVKVWVAARPTPLVALRVSR
jgi:hypothetical protein